MGDENVIKSHFIFHGPLIFDSSRKTHVFFFMGHELNNPHGNSIFRHHEKSSLVHAVFIIIKKP